MTLPDRWVQLQAQIHAGQCTVEQAVQAQIQQAQHVRAQFACVVDTLPSAAPLPGPLAGLVLAHKDIFELQDRLPGCGVQHGQAQPGVKPASAVAALAQAGAIQWASLVMAPHACGATAHNPHFAPCVNPLDPEATVGGSSSGSAVAVAAGMTYAALGTDTAGSVRIPAASCGLIGLKTTHGAVSTQGCAPLAPSLDSIGVLSRGAEDARQIWQVLCPQAPRPKPQSSRLLTQTRCHVWLPQTDVQPEVSDAIHHWVQQLGVATSSVDLASQVAQLNRHAQRVLFYETAQTHRAALLAGQADPAVEAIGRMGLAIPDDWYQASLRLRAAFLAQFVADHFAEADLLILPSLACLLPDWQTVEVGHAAFDRRTLAAMHAFMGFVNYLGLPALNLPIARDARQRPLCVQVLARPFAEHQLLDFATQVELKNGSFDHAKNTSL